MAWAEKMPSGRWRGGYRDTAGTKQYVSDEGRGFERKTDAKEAAEDAAAKARRRSAVVKGTQSATITWGQWWQLLAEDRTFDGTDTAAKERYVVSGYLMPKWGHVPMNKITYQAVNKWVWEEELKVRNGMSPGYARKIYSLFSLSMKAALQGESPLLEASPCAGVKLPKITKRARPYLSVTTMQAMAPELRGDYRDALEYDLETGLRPGEICGLHADRIDLDRGWMLVAEVFVTRRRIIRPSPKDDDVRMVPLTDKAIEIAKRRLEGRDLRSPCGVPHSDGATCTSPLVFLTDRGRAMSPDGMRNRMTDAARRANVERRSPYAVRRGFATRAAEGGLDAFQIAEILGHSTLDQAQQYVQQTPAARMRLSAALSKYPQLIVLEGGVGQSGTESGANPNRQPPERTVKRSVEKSG